MKPLLRANALSADLASEFHAQRLDRLPLSTHPVHVVDGMSLGAVGAPRGQPSGGSYGKQKPGELTFSSVGEGAPLVPSPDVVMDYENGPKNLYTKLLDASKNSEASGASDSVTNDAFTTLRDLKYGRLPFKDKSKGAESMFTRIFSETPDGQPISQVVLSPAEMIRRQEAHQTRRGIGRVPAYPTGYTPRPS